MNIHQRFAQYLPNSLKAPCAIYRCVCGVLLGVLVSAGLWTTSVEMLLAVFLWSMNLAVRPTPWRHGMAAWHGSMAWPQDFEYLLPQPSPWPAAHRRRTPSRVTINIYGSWATRIGWGRPSSQ